jgi:hypothetical protein
VSLWCERVINLLGCFIAALVPLTEQFLPRPAPGLSPLKLGTLRASRTILGDCAVQFTATPSSIIQLDGVVRLRVAYFENASGPIRPLPVSAFSAARLDGLRMANTPHPGVRLIANAGHCDGWKWLDEAEHWKTLRSLGSQLATSLGTFQVSATSSTERTQIPRRLILT